MPIDIDGARNYVHGNGTLFERALFAWMCDEGSLERLHQIILCYKNPDAGFGHGFEHDLKAPQSNPLALEYLLGVMKHTEMPSGRLLVGVSDWVENQMQADGSLRNPAEIHEYPLAPWWQEWGGQTMPDAIVGNLIHFGCATGTLIERTKRWVLANTSEDKIMANEWLFMAYHAFDFFFAVNELPGLQAFREATIENIVACALAAPENQFDSVFSFAPTPDSMIAQALPAGFIDRCLDVLEEAQQEDGSWLDQHNLPQWYPITTFKVLLALRRFGRW